MGVKKTQGGFTILETMIVLAITSVLLVSTILLVSGQIERYRFRTSVATFEQILRDEFNNVSDGYFGETPDSSAIGSGSTSCGDIYGDSSSLGDSDCVYSGKKVTIDAANKNITTVNLAVKDDYDPLQDSNLNRNEFVEFGQVQRNLPGGVDYDFRHNGNTLEVYFIYNKFTSDGDTKYGSQAVRLYTPDNPQANGAQLGTSYERYICLIGADNNARISFGLDGDFGIRSEYAYEGSC
jgi:prepilin-type N-terminal cleavage/methylation domain-containing protein